MTTECPNCFRTNKPKLQVHEKGNGRIVVTEYCGFCRNRLSQRESTNEIERLRRDIRNLKRKIDGGEKHLTDTYALRILRYNQLVRDL